MSGDGFRARLLRYYQRRWPRYVFIHINKTGGSSIEKALDIRLDHKTARQKKAELGQRKWDRAFKFAFVRNPWDKVVSHYHYRVRTNQTGMGDGHIGFRDWVLRAYGEQDPQYYDLPRMFGPQVDWVSDESGALIVDFVGHFERIQDDFAQVCRQIGIQASLPWVKATPHAAYQDLYDSQTREIVAERFAPDCAAFGYRFEPG